MLIKTKTLYTFLSPAWEVGAWAATGGGDSRIHASWTKGPDRHSRIQHHDDRRSTSVRRRPKDAFLWQGRLSWRRQSDLSRNAGGRSPVANHVGTRAVIWGRALQNLLWLYDHQITEVRWNLEPAQMGYRAGWECGCSRFGLRQKKVVV